MSIDPYLKMFICTHLAVPPPELKNGRRAESEETEYNNGRALRQGSAVEILQIRLLKSCRPGQDPA